MNTLATSGIKTDKPLRPVRTPWGCCWYSHLACELWGQSAQSLPELCVIFASSVGKKQEVGSHLGVEQTDCRLRRKEGNTHSETTTEFSFIRAGLSGLRHLYCVVCFHTLTTCLSSRMGTLYSMIVESREEITYKCGRLRVSSCLVAPVRTRAGS